MGENLKIVLAEFSTLSLAAFVMGVIASHRQARPHLDLKTWPWFCPVSRLEVYKNSEITLLEY